MRVCRSMLPPGRMPSSPPRPGGAGGGAAAGVAGETLICAGAISKLCTPSRCADWPPRGTSALRDPWRSVPRPVCSRRNCRSSPACSADAYNLPLLPLLSPPHRGGRGGRGRGGRGTPAVSAVAGDAAAALGLGVGKKKRRGKKGKAVGLVEKSALAKEFEKVSGCF